MAGRAIPPRWISILLALALFVPAASAYAHSAGEQPDLATVVRCDPTTATGTVGGANPINAVVDMYIEDVVGLNAVDLRISFFDTTIAQVVDQLPASDVQIQPLNTFLQPDFVVRNTADNTAGTIRYAATQAFPNLPVDGSGPVARITFQGLQPGTFTMTWGTVELADVNGGLIQATTQPCVITFTSSTAVTLARFEAMPQLDHVLVAWETVSETDNAGFNLYRAESPSGPQTFLAYVPAQAPGSTQGFAYTYDDLPVQPGQTYWYWLEDVSLNGATEMHGPVSVTFQEPNAVGVAQFTAGAKSISSPWPLAWLVAVTGLALAALAGAALSTRRR